MSNESVHFSNGTAEVHSDPLELGHAGCKAVASFENCLARSVAKPNKYLLVCFENSTVSLFMLVKWHDVFGQLLNVRLQAFF